MFFEQLEDLIPTYELPTFIMKKS